MTKETTQKSGNRFLLILTAVSVAVALFAVFQRGNIPFRTAEEERVSAFGGWSYDQEDQLNAAAALVKAGLTDYQWNEDRLFVPASRRGEYEKVLGESQAIPRKPSMLKQEALDGMGAFEPESRAKLRDLYSSARQLEKTLESFEQIESASVGTHSRREQAGLYQKNVVTATVSVKSKGGRPIGPELVSSITMAARHHLGITNNADISVIDTVSGRSWLGSEGAVSHLNGSSYAMEEARLEELWTAKFREAFDYIPDVRVATAVELEPISEPDTAEKKDEKNAASQKIGLLFADEEFGADQQYGSNVPIQYVPRSIAVSIAIPETGLSGIFSQNGTADDSGPIGDRKERIRNQVHETASALLNPNGGTDEAFMSRIEVSFYTPFTENEERVFYPERQNAETTETEEAITGTELSSGTESAHGLELAKRLLRDRRAGYFFAALAFAAGIGVHSLVRPRSSKKREVRNTTAEQPEKKNCSVTSAPAEPSAEPNVQKPVPRSPEPVAEKVTGSEQSATHATPTPKERKCAELQRIFDDLDAEDELSDQETVWNQAAPEESDDETIGPSDNPGAILFTDKSGSLKDGRIDQGARQTAGPHFPIPAENEYENEEMEDSDRFSYTYRQNGLRFPEPASKTEEPLGRFAFLGELSSDALRALFAKQRPQTTALVAKFAPNSVRDQILNVLGTRLRAEVERRMKETETPDPKVIDAVEETLSSESGFSQNRA